MGFISINNVSVEEIYKAMVRINKTTRKPIYDLSIHNPINSANALKKIYKNLI